MKDPALAYIQINQRLQELGKELRHTNSESKESILMSCHVIRSHLSQIMEWAECQKK
jgi:hypothetical protein